VLQERGGFHSIRILTSTRGKSNASDKPTAQNIRAAGMELLKDKTKDDLVLLALSGHGVQMVVQAPGGKEKIFTFFCPCDAKLDEKVDSKTGRCNTLLNFEEPFEALQTSGAGVKLALVDACRNEISARNFDALQNTVPGSVLALFSCKAGERAWETKKLGKKGHGVFMNAVIEGLKGEAANPSGAVTWNFLTDYVQGRVKKDVQEIIGGGATQTPHNVGNYAGDPVVLVEERKGR
jgi:uncharacterized caspase-like protein